jgi:hypothetical protein
MDLCCNSGTWVGVIDSCMMAQQVGHFFIRFPHPLKTLSQRESWPPTSGVIKQDGPAPITSKAVRAGP